MSLPPAGIAVAPPDPLAELAPERGSSLRNPRRDLPRLARDPEATAEIEALLAEAPTRHELFLGDSRAEPPFEAESVHLVLTSPPYWTLKEYPDSKGQLRPRY